MLPGAVEEATAFLADKDESLARLAKVAELIEGFETPYAWSCWPPPTLGCRITAAPEVKPRQQLLKQPSTGFMPGTPV
ncbi:MAG: hypothetical protein R3F44_17145 [Candidatus Competibacteraceae bacterium]